jgi:excisionase family DNA binding protein
LSSSVLCRPPFDTKWLLGIPLRGRDGSRLGVLCILDRQRKELSRAQARAVMAIVRQLEAHLDQLLRPAAPTPLRPTLPLNLPERRTARRGSLDDGQQLLRSHEVASLFDVTERTVINWAASGKLPALRTIGGHLRFRSDDVANLLAGQPAAVKSG